MQMDARATTKEAEGAQLALIYGAACDCTAPDIDEVWICRLDQRDCLHDQKLRVLAGTVA